MTIPFKITPDEVQVVGLSESSGKNNIYVRGTGLNNNANHIVNLNGVDLANGTGRGLRLVILDGITLAVKHNHIYDIHGVESVRTDLSTKLHTLEDSDIFMMVSWDAIRTNSTLTNTMTNFLRSTRWHKVNNVDYRLPYACIGTGKLGITSEVIWDNGATSPHAELNISFNNHSDLGSCGYGKIKGNHKEATYSDTGYGFNGGIFADYGDDADELRHGEYVRLTAELKIDQVRKDASGKCSIYLYTTSGGEWGRSISVSTTNLEWTPVEIILDANSVWLNPRNDNKPDDRMYWSAYHMPSNIDDGTSYVRNVQIQRCGMNPRDNDMKKQVASPYQLGATNIYETPFHRVDWSKVTKRFLADKWFNYSGGYVNIPGMQYTVTAVKTLADWDKYPNVKELLIKHSGYDLGEIKLGNRIILEANNSGGTVPEFDMKGTILEVKNSSQHYIIENLGDEYEIFSTDDLGLYEVIHVIKTNGSTSSGGVDEVNLIDRNSVMEQLQSNQVKNLTSFGSNFDKDLVMDANGKILAKKFNEVL